jgi:hypothetical protein
MLGCGLRPHPNIYRSLSQLIFLIYRTFLNPLGKVSGSPQEIHLVGQTVVQAGASPLARLSIQRSHFTAL